MYSSRHDERITWFQSIVCGGVAGVVTRTVTSPLEVVKVLAQVGAEETQHGLAKTFFNVYKNEGIRAFWKGNWITCLRMFPYSSLQFLAFNSLMVSKFYLMNNHILISLSLRIKLQILLDSAWLSYAILNSHGSFSDVFWKPPWRAPIKHQLSCCWVGKYYVCNFCCLSLWCDQNKAYYSTSATFQVPYIAHLQECIKKWRFFGFIQRIVTIVIW